MDMIIKNVKLMELNTKTVNAFLNTQTSKVTLQNADAYVVIRIINNSLVKLLWNDFLLHTKFLTMISISLFNDRLGIIQ